MTDLPPPVARPSRRAVLLGGSALGLTLLLPAAGPVAGVPGRAPLFLSEAELATLRAVVARFVPGPPEDTDPGAREAGCAEAIDALLGAFTVDPPPIYAGAPFSSRGGAPHNDFADFVPLDAYEVLGWRLHLEGSRGRDDLERNGAIPGLQAVYRQGLAAVETASGPGGFAALPGPGQDLVLRSGDPAVAALVDVAFPQTLELYGPPEYGGNQDLAGWAFTAYDGDVLPRGYTREQVETHSPREGGLPLPLPAASAGLLAALTALATHEPLTGMLAAGDGTLSALTGGVHAALAGAVLQDLAAEVDRDR